MKINQTSFNIFSLWQLFRNHFHAYSKAVSITFVVGCVYVFSLPKTYTSSTVLAPEYSSGSTLGSLGSLASMAGINLNQSGTDVDAFNTTMYPDIVGSTPFMRELLKCEFTTSEDGTTMSLYSYLKDHQHIAWWNLPIVYMRHILANKTTENNNQVESPYTVSEEEDNILGMLKKSLDVIQDNTTELITINVTLQDPLVATVLADSVSKKLQTYIYEYRTKKAQADLQYAKTLCAEAKTKYEEALSRYAEFTDSHNNTVLTIVQSEGTKLENEMQMAFEAYTTLRQQETMAYAKVQSKAPVYTTMQPPLIPTKKSGPKSMLILIFMELMVISTLTGYYLVKEWKDSNVIENL